MKNNPFSHVSFYAKYFYAGFLTLAFGSIFFIQSSAAQNNTKNQDIQTIQNNNASSEAKKSILEVIVVSGQQSDHRAKDALVTSFIDSDRLAALNANHPNEFAMASPNTWISRGSGQEHLSAIRSPVFTGAGACGNFFMAEDGIALRAAGFCNANQLFDSFYEVADHIEFFRGPASSVLGSNAVFGGINITSPKLEETMDESSLGSIADVAFGITSQNSRHFAGKLIRSDFLFYGSILDDEGFRDESGVNQQKIGIKWRQAGILWQRQYAFFLNNLDQDTAGYIYGKNSYQSDEIIATNNDPNAYRKAKSVRFYSHWERDLGGDSGIVIKPYARWNSMEFSMHFVPWQPIEENGHQSLGVQTIWSKSYADLNLNLGSNLELTRGLLQETQYAPAPFGQDRFPEGMHYDYLADSSSLGLFATAIYSFSNKLTLMPSLRWDTLEFDYENQLASGSACATGVQDCRFYRPANRRDRFTQPSARLGFTYDIFEGGMFPNMTLFGGIGTAFRVPQAVELYRLQSPEQNNQVENTRLNGGDLGIRINSQSWSFEFIGFSMQLSDGIYQDDERNYLSGADTQHRGLEYSMHVDLENFLNQKISLKMNGAFNRHVYNNSPDMLDQTAGVMGNQIDTAPSKLHNLMLIWSYASSSQLGMSVTQYGRYFLDAENQHEYPGHTLLDVNWKAGWRDHWSLQINIKNLADKHYAERADFAFDDYRYFPGLPRRVEFTLQFH